jgi:hypothetical protein
VGAEALTRYRLARLLAWTKSLPNRVVLWATRRRRPYWTDLRSVSNSRAVRLVILIPLIGYWIILNDHVVAEYAKLSCLVVHCDPSTPKPIPWRLFATYFGLCWLAAGSLVYQLCCDEVIKRFPNPTAYSTSFAREVSHAEMDRVEDSLKREPIAAQRTLDHRTYFEGRNRGFPRVEVGQEVEVRVEFWRNILLEDFDLRNSRCYPGRLLVASCYIVGFIILIFPTVDVFLSVYPRTC